MAIFRIKCLECGDKFKVPSLNDVPRDCPLCGELINDQRERPEVAAPFIMLQGGARTKAIDQTYRDAEKSSEHRIEQAVAMTPGSSKEDFAHLKVTDYRSGMVEGESAVRMPQPSQEFQQNVAKLQGGGVQVQGSGVIDISGQAAGFMAATGAGPEPYAGAKALQRLRSVHSRNVDARMNNPVTRYPTMAERQPGYKPRA